MCCRLCVVARKLGSVIVANTFAIGHVATRGSGVNHYGSVVAAAPLGRSTILPSSRSQRVCNDLAERFVPSFSAFAAQLFGPSVFTSWRNCASSDSDHGFGFGLSGSLVTTRRFFGRLISWEAAVTVGRCGKATERARLVDSIIISLPAENARSQMLSSEPVSGVST